MPIYAPLTDIIPTPATGVVVPSAWGDQADDNLVHHYEGTWFRALGGATSLVANTYAQVDMVSGVLSGTADDEGTISVVGGQVRVTKPGIWWVFGCAMFGNNNLSAIAIGATDVSGGSYASECEIETGANHSFHCTSALIAVTSNPAVFTLNAYVFSGPVTLTVNNYAPRLSGVWLGEHP